MKILRNKYVILTIVLFAALVLIPNMAIAEHAAEESSHHGIPPVVFFYFAILLLAAKLGGIVEKIGFPSVLGELFAGIVLSFLGYLGWGMIDPIRTNEVIMFFAQFGAVLLLFQVGLESNIKQMMHVGARALGVALIGVVVPFVLGAFIIGPFFFPEASLASHLFIGASIVATSVGITASVFKTLGVSKSRAAQTVIGAAVVDDILGLLLLAIVTAVATGGGVTPQNVLMLTIKSFSFLAFAVLIGNIFAEDLSRVFSKIQSTTGMKLGVAIIVALGYAYAATLFGLEPIIGAFAAGLILDAVHFRFFDNPSVAGQLERLNGSNDVEKAQLKDMKHAVEHAHVEDMVSSVSYVFVPLFFAYTGLLIDIPSLLNPSLYGVAIIISLLAVMSKFISGLAANGPWMEKMAVGFSMVPRGEVGLIFLSVGKALGAIDNDLFSTLLIVMVVTTFIAPIALKVVCQRVDLNLTENAPSSEVN